ncbi:uncharacterized protein LOC126374846 [Pectinophora gossypiella]|uniref:uncharacterized protein LOC126374846 n=1 Tax=Pectinophora gossypiella TaxID=13191 RepID=UPI00214E3CC4|nr:uncharacterized protein LOC126374846 [Pectinophora gossypiella]
MRCNIPSCIPGDGEEAVRHQRRYHKPTVFNPPKPPTPLLVKLKAKLLSIMSDIKGNLTTIYNSTYYWGIVKSVTMFVLGMKLFYDIAAKLAADCEAEREARRQKQQLRELCEEWEKSHNMKIVNYHE